MYTPSTIHGKGLASRCTWHIKPPVAMPVSHIKCQSESKLLRFNPALAAAPGEAVEGSMRVWVPKKHVGSLAGVPHSCFLTWAVAACATWDIWEMNQGTEKSVSSFSLLLWLAGKHINILETSIRC